MGMPRGKTGTSMVPAGRGPQCHHRYSAWARDGLLTRTRQKRTCQKCGRIQLRNVPDATVGVLRPLFAHHPDRCADCSRPIFEGDRIGWDKISNEVFCAECTPKTRQSLIQERART